MSAVTLPAARQNLKRRFCRSHLRAAAAHAGTARLSAVHDHLAEVGPARVVRPNGVGVAVGVDGDADEVQQIAVAAEQTADALPANVAAMHYFGNNLAHRPLRGRSKPFLRL